MHPGYEAKIRYAVCNGLIYLLLVATAQAREPGLEVEEIVVLGRPEFLETQFRPDRAGFNIDVSRLMSRVPGGSVNTNGPLTGQFQYRGMSGPRVNVRVDGMLIHGGGPNWMAPPLHHIPTGLMEEIVVEKGIASISTGGGIGGAASAKWKKPDFSEVERWQASGDVEIGGSTADAGSSLSGVLGLSSDEHRLFAIGSRDAGDDYEAGDGSVAATEYRRGTYGFGYGLRLVNQRLDFDWRRLETDDTGTPSLPMDIDWFDTDLWNFRYATGIGDTSLEFRVYGSEIDHGMNNFLLRKAPDFSSLPMAPFQGQDKRLVRALSDEIGFKLKLDRKAGPGKLVAGIEGKFAEHDVTVKDPDVPAFFVENFSGSESDTLIGFAQWSAVLGSRWYLETGISAHRVNTSTQEVDALPAQLVDRSPEAFPTGTPPRAVWLLRERFNNSDLTQNDTNMDWVLKGRYQAAEAVVVEFGVARKERSPIYQERYLWIPLEVNAGIGDGNNYVGNPELDPETSHQIELGLDVDYGDFQITPRVFYRKVDDYIQGVPVENPVTLAVSGNANGDATPLSFANTEASYWGADLHFGAQLAAHWRLDGSASMVRAERDDINDNLFRISPDTLRATLSYNRGGFTVQLEQVVVAEQDKLSRTNTLDPGNLNNRFEETSGYGLTHLFVTWKMRNDMTFTTGLENIWDKHYTDHQTGFNRVIDSEVPRGQRLPGQGRNLFARLRYRF